jgi:YHS domain-containing protein
MKQMADQGIKLENTPASAAQKVEKAPAPAAVPAAAADVKTGKPQTICPVMGGPINRSVYTDYKGKRIYFCCPACIDTFNKDAEKFMKQMSDQGIKCEDTPKAK